MPIEEPLEPRCAGASPAINRSAGRQVHRPIRTKGGRNGVEMAPYDWVGDQSPAFRADLKAQSKGRRERLSSLASAPPLRRRNDLLLPLAVEGFCPADLVGPARKVTRQEAAHIRTGRSSMPRAIQ